MDRNEFQAIAEGFNEEYARTIGGIVRSQGIVGAVSHRSVSHLAGGRATNDPSATQLSNGMLPAEVSMELSIDALEVGDTARLIETLVNAGNEMRSQLAGQIFARMDEIAEQNDMVVDARGEPFSADTFIQLLEKMDIEFDAAGQAIMPEVRVHPSNVAKIRAALDTDEAKAKIAAVIEKKKKAKGL